MQKMNRIFSVIILLHICLISNVLGQDSLVMKALEQKARASYGSSLDSSIYYAQQILDFDSLESIPKYHAFALNWIGICLMRKGYPDSAEVYYQKTIRYSTAYDVSKYEKMAKLNRSINFYQQGYFEKAADAAEESLHAFEDIGDSLGIAHAYYNLANCLFQLGRPEEALTFYKTALPVYIKNEAVLPISNTYNGIGSVYQKREDFEESIKFFRKSVANKIAVGGENFCASEYINIATSFKNLANLDSAQLYYHKAQLAASSLGDQQKVATAYLDMAVLFNETGAVDSAKLYAAMANKLSQKINDKFLQYNSLSQLALANKALGFSSQAFEQLLASKKLEDSISSAEVEAKVIALEKKFKLAEKDKELLHKKIIIAENKESLLFQKGMLLLLFLVIIIILIWLRTNRIKQKFLHKNALQKERNRIAMDLHDHVGAELTLVNTKLDTRAFTSERSSEKKELEAISEQIRNVGKILRETVWSIQEETITTGQLQSRIQDFANKLLEGQTIEFKSFSDEKEVELSPQMALTLFRIGQEGITNALKYAKATEVSVAINKQGAILSFSIEDNGDGFDPKKVEKGFGLQNMEQRTEQLGGTFNLSSTIGRGTIITVTVSVDGNV